MVDNLYPISLEITLREFLVKILWTEELSCPVQHSLSLELLKKFHAAGCSYYDLISTVSSVNSFSEKELEILISLSPTPKAGLSISPKNIRECIPRWTASKYHTAPIAKIVGDVQNLLTENACGITVFNSNLNVRDKRAINDQYVLLISKEHRIFLDINRKTTISFITEQ